MRRQAELRSIPRQEGRDIPVKSAKSGTVENLSMSPTERTIVSSLRDMERFMEEAFHRPLFGMPYLPFRHMFRDVGSFGDLSPSVDVYEEKNEVVVKTELPGIKRDDISVKLVGNVLHITGEKKAEDKVERKDYLRLERSYGTFHRTLNLPEDIDYEKTKASFKDGVLEVRITRAGEKSTTREIAVE